LEPSEQRREAEHKDEVLSPNIVRAGDLSWVRARVAQMTSGWARTRGDAPVIHRKADPGAEAKGAEAEVSKPGDAAEKEADAVADHVAEGLHSDKKKQARGG
jgi:hypothetical protein